MTDKVKLKKKKRLWISLAVAVAIGGGVAYYYARKRSHLEIRYREAKVEKGVLSVTILATGVVQPENRLEIKPPVAGRVEQVLVKEGQNVRKGQTLAYMSSTERAALLDAAMARGAAEAKQWKELYKPTPVIAPINGTIILRNIESGQTVTASDAILVMSDRLTIKAQVDETDIAQIHMDQRAAIVLDAYQNEKIGGKVVQIAYDAKTVNNVTTYIVDVLPDDRPAFMRSGMTANVRFFVAERQDALLIPSDSVKVSENKFYVMVKSEEKKDGQRRPVKLGLSDGKKTEVLEGLREGDVILIAQLKPGGTGNKGSSPFSPMGGGGGGRKR